MVARALAFLLLLSTTPLLHAFTVEEQLDDLMPLLADLAELGGYGVLPYERAAFIVREEDGTFGCVVWPFTGQFQRTTVRAVIPSGTVAIAHTHPRTSPFASSHDREEARRLSVPIIIVGRSTLQWIDGAGQSIVRRSGVRWDRNSDPERRCRVSRDDSNIRSNAST